MISGSRLERLEEVIRTPEIGADGSIPPPIIREDTLMPVSMAAPQILDQAFFEIRANLLELAASFDRLDRGEGSVRDDPRIKQIHEALQVLLEERRDRAEEVQLIFSLPYNDDWQDNYNINRRFPRERS